MSLRFITPLAIIFVMGCKDAQESQEDKKFDKSVGAPISMETATRWTNLFERRPDALSRLHTCTVSHDFVERFVADENLHGIAFHYAIDDAGDIRLLVAPVGDKSILWNSELIVDASTNQAVAAPTALEWAKRYQEQHPEGLWYHFFGIEIFHDMIKNRTFDAINVKPALNDAGAPQLLLFLVTQSTAAENGKSQDLFDTAVYDASNACPPCPRN